MATKSDLVNLDAMIKREDFEATNEEELSSFDTVATISLRDFTKGGLIGSNLRKPDFQRETNHWNPDQVVSLLECFLNGDLIPSVILWRSPTYIFVIDGGHRLSVLKAWIEDDYGDGPTSQPFFGYEISGEQKKNANKTRDLVNKKIGSWQHLTQKLESDSLDPIERKRLTPIVSRAIQIQWVKGDADKAASSFFKINTKGTPLDDIEELLLRNRKKPISIASRAIIRAGKGHKYWSSFGRDVSAEIENNAKDLHTLLFDPEIKNPIKTLDLPLGGPKGVRTAIQALIELALISVRDQNGSPKLISDEIDDVDGEATVKALKKISNLVSRVTGNVNGSLGLHPAVYFYGPTGRHSNPMFMGVMSLIGRKLSNNDKLFFVKFTKIRSQLESILINKKDLFATILQKNISMKRAEKHELLLDKIIKSLDQGEIPSDEEIVEMAGLGGKLIVGDIETDKKNFNDDDKSKVFIHAALASALKCPICNGYLSVEKSVSYDHIQRLEDGGNGSASNCQLSHPYCNQSIKN